MTAALRELSEYIREMCPLNLGGLSYGGSDVLKVVFAGYLSRYGCTDYVAGAEAERWVPLCQRRLRQLPLET